MKIKNKLTIASLSICFIAIIFLCNSCTKDQTAQIDNGYHINFTMNGVTQRFDQADTCQLTTDNSSSPAMQDLSIRGHNSLYAMAHASIIELAVVSSDPITTGTYVDSSSNDNYAVYADYIPYPDVTYAPGTNLYMAGDGVYTDGIQQGVQLSHHLTITITSIDKGTMKGTFSGDFYEYDTDIHQATIESITNGDFYLKMQ
jgi:hypothetical protein